MQTTDLANGTMGGGTYYLCPQLFLSILKCSTSLLNTHAPRIIVVMAEKMIAETLRDLIQCVQAARDGAPGHSLFAMQCDLVLDRAAQLMPGVLVERHTR